MKIKRITLKNKEYPHLLREVYKPPTEIYYIGSLPQNETLISIVGSRKITSYGKDVTYRLSFDLAKAGATIVSGLALGADTMAHKAALDAGGKTIAVLACGLNQIYPATNRDLAKKILLQDGCIISEYPEGTPPLRQHFVARNRLISGLSEGVIVTEAPSHSGALITANFALEQNRLVMAVPGNVTNPMSTGTNNLIKAGGSLVTGAQDALSMLGLESLQLEFKAVKAASAEEQIVLDLLAGGINDSEEMIRQSEMSASQFNQVIGLMEISGKVRNVGAGKWVGS